MLNYLKHVDSEKENAQDVEKSEKELRERLIRDFVKKNTNKYSEILSAIDIGDIKLANRLAHTLKSNAGLLEVRSLQLAASEVELQLVDGINNVTREQLGNLEKELNSALEAFIPLAEIYEQNLNFEKTEPLDPSEVNELFENLRSFLMSGNMESLNLVGDLRRVPETGELINQIEDLEFTKALEILSAKFNNN